MPDLESVLRETASAEEGYEAPVEDDVSFEVNADAAEQAVLDELLRETADDA